MHISRLFYFNFIEEMKKIEFVGPFRVPPSRTYLFSGEGPDSVGVHGERAIDIMTIDNLKRSKDKRDIVKKTSEWFKKCGISDELGINPLTDRHFEVFLSQMGLKENIADTGYGCSQVLPILVAGYNLKEGDILVVQEPEIHLHPRAQAELGTFFYELSKQGIQTMIETHSEHMLLRLQAHIADKKSNLKPEDINVYYIYVDDDKRIIRKLELKNDGFFKYDWPQGFFPERYNEAKKIAKASLEG
jgi:predicted ATPase